MLHVFNVCSIILFGQIQSPDSCKFQEPISTASCSWSPPLSSPPSWSSTITIGSQTPTKCQTGYARFELNIFFQSVFPTRYESFFFSGSLGCWGCLGQERRSQGRQSWSRTRWRRWTWRRTPPSPSWRTSSIWTMTSALLRSTITSSHRRPTSPKAHKATLLVFSGSISCFYLAPNIVQALFLTPPHYEESFTKIIFIFSQISSLCFLLQIFEEKIPIYFLNIYSNIFLRVSLTPPHYEESFSSSGVHRELSSILKEIRVKLYCNLHIFAIFACLIILGEHILSKN